MFNWRFFPQKYFSKEGIQFSSVAQSCLTLWDPMDCSTPGFPVHHQLLTLAQAHVQQVGEATNHLILCHSFSSCLQYFSASGSFQISQLFTSGGQSIEVSASVSVLSMKIQDWFSPGLTGLISLQSEGFSRVFSNTTVLWISSLVFSFLYCPTLMSIHDYWKNHSFD